MAAFTIVDRVSAALFGTLSRVRGKRIFHPHGVAYRGQLKVTRALPGKTGAALRPGTTYLVIARLSWGLGVPEGWPDILGFALRLPEVYGPLVHQDILMVTSGNNGLTHYAMIPTPSFSARPFSTVLVYQVSGWRRLFGVRAKDTKMLATNSSELKQLAQAGNLIFELLWAKRLGSWEVIGEITLTQEMTSRESEQLRFNPWHTGAGIVPAGFLNRLRRNAYVASQQGRQAADTENDVLK